MPITEQDSQLSNSNVVLGGQQILNLIKFLREDTVAYMLHNHKILKGDNTIATEQDLLDLYIKSSFFKQ